ncbi:MAG: aminotransferase class I/II-fold pyridoxal phosphate-dependent enzyme [Anaerolineae bacterium]|nr:aminotransferase class I/II-fold pyridoxal phosphate-dependent enzyme [Anaerolineae bacterium]
MKKIYEDPRRGLMQLAKQLEVYPYYLPLTDSEGTVVRFGDQEVIMLGSNNYLGLTMHPKVREAAKAAIDRWGTSCTGSRLVNGTLDLHVELDRRLAAFVAKEAGLVFSTGYQTNLGTISALVGKGDFAIIDREDHASIVDGCLLARGTNQIGIKRFSHNDPDSLEDVLKRLPNDAGRLVVVDGVYSMAGDIAPLPEIVEICKRHGARIMVDDAHSLGVLGGGRGTAAHFDLTDEVDLIMGTFSKTFASIGGFIAGDPDVIEHIKHHGRAMMFSAALPAHNVATVLAVLDIMESEPEHVERLWENSEFMRAGFKKLGYDTGASTTPVIPVYFRDKAMLDRALANLPLPQGIGVPREGGGVRLDVALPARRGRVYQRRRPAGRAGHAGVAPHQLHGDAHESAPLQGARHL